MNSTQSSGKAASTFQNVIGFTIGMPSKRLKYEQILVAGDDTVAVTRKRSGEHLVVVRVAAHGAIQRAGINQVYATLQQCHHGLRIADRGTELAAKRRIEFCKQRGRGDQGMVANTVLEQFAACTAGDEGGDQDVRVKQHPHETWPNTSSSVTTPRASALAIKRERSRRKLRTNR